MTPADFDHALEQAKREALAEFAAGAGHEINNPLATILGRTELLLRRVERLAPSGESAEAARDLHIISGQVQRIRDMIGDLMVFARPPAPKLERCDLSEAVRTALKTITTPAVSQGVELRQDLVPDVVIQADRTQLAVVICELLRNALQATTRGQWIEVVTRSRDGAACLVITDNGTGLSEIDQQHLFDPFYSGRQAGRGLGFGLCKCWRIVQQHGGFINVTPRSGGGVTATVEFRLT